MKVVSVKKRQIKQHLKTPLNVLEHKYKTKFRVKTEWQENKSLVILDIQQKDRQRSINKRQSEGLDSRYLLC